MDRRLLLIPAGLLAVLFAPVVLRKATLVPHAPGVYHTGPMGYENAPPQCVQDPWGTVWTEIPLARVVRSQAARGLAPLWNPYTACGTPLAAGMHSQAFSPLRWPVFLNPSPVVWDFFFLFRLLAAGVLMMLLCGALGMGPAGAVAGGCAYMLSGYMVSYLNLFHLDVDAVLPGLLLSIVRLAGGGGALWSAAMTGFVAQMLLGGNPQAALVGLAFAGAFAWTLGWRRGVKGLAGRLAWPALAGLALAAPLLLPFAELFLLSFHVHSADTGTWWGGTVLPWQGLPALLVPLSFGRIFAPEGFPVQALIPYAGAGTLMLAIQGLGWGPRLTARIGWFMGAVALLELGKIFGMPPLNWLGGLPGFGMNVWVKYAAPLYLALAFLAGLGVERIGRGAAGGRRFAAFAAVLGAAALLAGVKSGAMPHFLLGWGFALLLVAAYAGVVFARGGVDARTRAWLAFALLAAELFAWAPRGRARVHDPLARAPYLEFLQRRLPDPGAGRIFGLGFNLVPNLSAAFGLADARTVDALIYKPYFDFMDREIASPRPLPFTGFLLANRLDARAMRGLSFLGVKYIFSTWPPERFLAPGTDWPLKEVFGGRMRVYENPLAGPRSFLLPDDTEEKLVAGIISYGPQEVTVAPPAGSGELVLTDAALPGWRAFAADGKRLKVRKYMGAFRSVRVQGRVGAVRFVYAPLSFSFGLLLAGFAGLGGVLAFAAARIALPRKAGRAR